MTIVLGEMTNNRNRYLHGCSFWPILFLEAFLAEEDFTRTYAYRKYSESLHLGERRHAWMDFLAVSFVEDLVQCSCLLTSME